VLVISAREAEGQKVRLLDAGADDYLVKPFGVGELLARMRVALRHRGTALQPATTRYVHGGVTIDLGTQRVRREESDVHLTPTEFKLLACLVRQAGRVVTHRRLLADVWGAEFSEHTHYLRLYMAQLRAKLEADPAEPALLLTETGASTGAIQIAGTDSDHQLPFFVTTCDYTLIGEELYAASAYLSREPVQVGTLRGQDIGKAVVLGMLGIGTALATLSVMTGLDVSIVLDLFKDLK